MTKGWNVVGFGYWAGLDLPSQGHLEGCRVPRTYAKLVPEVKLGDLYAHKIREANRRVSLGFDVMNEYVLLAKQCAMVTARNMKGFVDVILVLYNAV